MAVHQKLSMPATHGVMLFLAPDALPMARAFATSPHRKEKVLAASDLFFRVVDVGGVRLYAVFFPAARTDSIIGAWQNPGIGISSRLAELALKRGVVLEEVEIFRDGELAALTEIIIVDEGYPHHHTHHVHRKEKVLVTVYYGGQERPKEFKRRATIDHVLEWSIKEFHIDPSLASEMELALHGSETELPGDEHVGHLAGKHKTLALDLIRGKISNG